MPELPEVEVLAQYLRPLLIGRTIRRVEIRRDKVLHPTRPAQFRRTLTGARFTQLVRRGKYLLFQLQSPRAGEPIELLGHLGMTGRMYLAPRRSPEPKHAAVVLHLGPPPPVISAARRERGTITRSDCGFMIAPASRAAGAGGRSVGSSRRPAAPFSAPAAKSNG